MDARTGEGARAERDLNEHQAAVMDLFDRQSEWHVGSLADELETTASGAARTCNALERMGLVELIEYPPAVYEITPKGQAWWDSQRTYNPVRGARKVRS